MEVIIALQVAWDRQQPWLDLTSMGFCYFVDFQTMTQINRQTQRRIQRRSDMVYPLVSGPLPKTSQAWGTGSGSGGIAKGLTSGGGSTRALLGVGVSGSTLSRKGSVVYPSGTLSVSSLAPPGQPCACQQCMLVLSVKANGTSSQTLGRATKPNSPKSNFGTLPSSSASMYGTSLKCSLSEKAKNSAAFDQSLSLLTSGTANLSISSSRPLPPTLPSPNKQPSSAPSSSSSATFVPTAMLINTSTSPSSSTDLTSSSTSLPFQRSAACAAPLPSRASLTGLSRPALQRIAMAQSRALIASG